MDHWQYLLAANAVGFLAGWAWGTFSRRREIDELKRRTTKMDTARRRLESVHRHGPMLH